jgi:protein-S-isoprenylcysteine O-methyltransferase Ste14
VGLLVIPGIGLLFGSWMWLVIGVVLYLSSRVFSGQEERKLGELFPEEYRLYRERVLLPWL